jgi:hypothetical protein
LYLLKVSSRGENVEADRVDIETIFDPRPGFLSPRRHLVSRSATPLAERGVENADGDAFPRRRVCPLIGREDAAGGTVESCSAPLPRLPETPAKVLVAALTVV